MSKSIIIFLVCLSFWAGRMLAQTNSYFIRFTDKNNSAFSISNPQQFLSPKSIQRRRKQNIPTRMTDIPVNQNYINQVASKGVNIKYPLKWFNGVVVEATATQIDALNALPFVLGNKKLDISTPKETEIRNLEKGGTHSIRESQQMLLRAISPQKTNSGSLDSVQYRMIGLDSMHARNFTGQGITIAVFDAGFYRANLHAAFSRLYQNNRVLNTYDIVSGGNSVYEDDKHGTEVLSNIAAYSPGSLVGGAYDASFYLIRTENVVGEEEIETFNWIRAAELSDSLGVDIISSSVGYYSFDINTANNYTYAMMNGRTIYISQAAQIAARVGMIVVNSAGNEGNNLGWNGKITAPGDADSVLCVGAVQSNGNYASLSGKGPTADGRIKPDVAARGSSNVVANTSNLTGFRLASGTSFAAPLITGLVAGFWQANPGLTANQVAQFIRQSGNKASNPDTLTGYGIPHFARASALVSIQKSDFPNQKLIIFPNPGNEKIFLKLPENINGNTGEVHFIAADGKVVLKKIFKSKPAGNMLDVDVKLLAKGIYTIQLKTKSGVFSASWVKSE